MKGRAVIGIAVAWVGFVLVASAPAAERPPGPPNFIVIFADDLGYGDIGPYGATKQRTPHLDRMAAEGMKLTSFYAAPVCSVSRAQLLTGCYGPRVSVTGVFFPACPHGLHPAEKSIAERLRPLGYATACVGKWHLGDQPEFLPTKRGFERYFGIPYSNDMQRPSAETGRPVVPLLRDDAVEELLTDERQRTLVERMTDEALCFIRDSRERPFFLYVPHTAVHTPIFPGEKFRGTSGNGRFGDWVQELDWSVGRILDTLDDLGLDRDTLVVFTSDNGPWTVKGADGGSAGPLRGAKGSTWEGGVRVPTIAWWPGRIQPGTACDAVAGTIDITPTLVGLAGGSVPAEPAIDGRDLAPLLEGRACQSPREAHYYFLGESLQAVRQGRWKLALAPQGDGTQQHPGPRLYDLDSDVGERTDVAADHPEIVNRLQALAAGMAAELCGRQAPGRRPSATVAAPGMLYPTGDRKRKQDGGQRVPKPEPAAS